MPAVLRHDISISDYLQHLPDEVIWNAFDEMGEIDTPFALLGALDVAINRAGSDSRFHDFAAETIERLCSAELIGRGGQDVYQLMPHFVHLCVNWMCVNENFAHLPPYWRRLAAFVHAHFLIDSFSDRNLDIDVFEKWCDGHFSKEMLISSLLDLQSDPMWRPDQLTRMSLRAEIIGRLELLAKAAKDKGQLVPKYELIEAAVKEINGLAHFPGPLEGHHRHAITKGGAVFYTEDARQLLGEDEVTNYGYTDLMVDGAPSPHQSDTTLRWLIDGVASENGK